MNFPDHAAIAAIAALDLDPIKVKLMHRESGEGWSLAYAEAIEAEYRRFLQLMQQYPEEQAAPGFDVDTFWHYHILDTLKYAVDCDAVFGYFLHHFPYMGLRGEDDEAAHAQAGERMQQLYETTFGVPYARDAAAAARAILEGGNRRDPNGVAFSLTPTPAGPGARDPGGIAFSLTPTPAQAGARDPAGVAFSLTPTPAHAAGRDPAGIAFSLTPTPAHAAGRDPAGVAFSLTPTPAHAAGRDPAGVAFSLTPTPSANASGALAALDARKKEAAWRNAAMARPTLKTGNTAN